MPGDPAIPADARLGIAPRPTTLPYPPRTKIRDSGISRQDPARPRWVRGNERGGTACNTPPTRSVKDVQSSKVYRFVGKDGVVSFSDREPAAAEANNLSKRYRRREQYFRLRLLHDQAPNAVRMQAHIMADTQQIFVFLTRHLEVENLRQVYLNLRLLPSKASFRAYRRKVAPTPNTTAGFYMPSKNEAVVRLHKGRNGDQRTLEVIRHESSHLIAAALFGNLPSWLNEGLSEYFERMEIQDLAKVIRPSPGFLKLLRKKLRHGNLPSLDRHLHLSNKQWRRKDQSLSYGIAWSLIYYLMSEAEGRHFLAELLDAQAKHRCRPFTTSEFVEQHYRDGIAGLDREWREWLAGPPPPAHYY
jgi:hypothetical protein